MELPPAPPAAVTVCRDRPLTCPDDGQTRAIEHEMEALAGRDRPQTACQRLAREGARRMLMAALQVEVAQSVDAYQEARDARGRRLVVRHGQAEARKVRVNDTRVDATGQRERFTSRILPPSMRRSPQVAEVLSMLSLRGLSTGDFREALPVLLGDDAAGLSAPNIARLPAVWEDEYRQFRQRDLADRDYVYVWVDGLHFNIRLEDDRLCTLVVIGARADGTTELVALEDGYHERAESWAELLRGLPRRGLEAPVVAVGDGGPGVLERQPGRVAPDGRAARLVPQVGKCPGQRLQPKAKRALHDILAAETHEQAEEHLDTFVAEYEAKYPKAAACLATDRETLLTFLRLSGRTLDSSPDHERHRIAVRHGPLAATGHQGGRLPHQGPTDGLQVARHGPAAVAATQCRTPAAARTGWCDLHRRSAAETKHRGGSEGSRLITLIADPQLLTISPARSEYRRCPSRRPLRRGVQAVIASDVNHNASHRRVERRPGCRSASSQRGTSPYTWDEPSTASL